MVTKVITFLIHRPPDLEGGAIQPLSTVVEQIRFADILFWSLRQITFTCDLLPFGISVLDIEKMSNEMKQGFIMSDVDFRTLLTNGIQIIDGYIDGYAGDCQEPRFQIECIDSSQWEISTSSDEFAGELDKKKFKRIS
jgi:hypothetical protein